MSASLRLFSILFVFCCFLITVLSKKIICESKQTVYLNRNEFYFVETPNFPQSLKNDCRIVFKTKNLENNDGIFFAVTNGILNNATVTHSNNTIDVNNTSLFGTFSTNELIFEVNADRKFYNAFKGMVMLDDRSEKQCAFDYFNSSTPYKFKDETELFLVASPFKKIKNEEYAINCSWYFSAPYFYKFKIWFYNTVERAENFLIMLDNGDTKTFFNKTHVKQSSEVYGDNFLLSLNAYSKKDIAFYCIVSVIKLKPDIVKENCTVTKNGNVTIWTNIDANMNGYSNNAKCSFSVTVPWNTELIMYVDEYAVIYPDAVNSYINNKPVKFGYANLNSHHEPIYLQSKEEGIASSVLFEFISDDNIQSIGFKFTFIERECKCGSSDIIVPCEGVHYYNIMNTKDNHFCGNLKCKFTVKADPSCSHKNVLLSAKSFYTIDSFANVEIDSNNVTIFKANEEIHDDYDIPLLSNRTNILFFSSFKSDSFRLQAKTYDPITVFNHVELTLDAPFHVLDTQLVPHNSIFTVKLGDDLIQNNDSLQIFLYSKRKITFMDKDLIKIYRWNRFLNSVIPENSLTLYLNIDQYRFTIFFRAVKRQSRNCAFTENVKKIDDDKSRYTMLAKPSGYCEMIFLYLREIKQWWTSSTDRPIKVLTANNKFLFEFNKETAHKYNFLLEISTHFYKVVIPANVSLILDIEGFPRKKEPSARLKSSYLYDKCLQEPVSRNEFIHTNNNSTFIITILDLKLSPNASLLIDKQKYMIHLMNSFTCDFRVKNVGQILYFTKSSIKLIYEEMVIGCFRYLFRVDIVPKEET